MEANTQYRPRPWFTGPVTAQTSLRYDDAADALPPELAAEDNVEWLAVGDTVRIERTVRRSDAAPVYGTIRRVNADVQYALVELDVSGFWEWLSLDEVFLAIKAGALETATARPAEAERAI